MRVLMLQVNDAGVRRGQCKGRGEMAHGQDNYLHPCADDRLRIEQQVDKFTKKTKSKQELKMKSLFIR
jgi:hypothetical protein